MSYKIGMVSLGCPKNQVDAEMMLSLLSEADYEIETDESRCDAIIINTCGFIEDAKREGIEVILELSRLKESAHLKAIIVTGCMAERYKDELQRELPEVDAVVGIGSNRQIAGIVQNALAGKPANAYDSKSCHELNGARILSTPSYTAYLRVADGCDNCCSFCAIPLIRGRYRSRKMEDIVREAKLFASGGTRELVLVAQDTTRYGEDLYGALKLPDLLKQLSAVEGIRWIRILYTYPDRITDRLLTVMAEEPKILPYLDIPLQHTSKSVLRRMNRSGGRESLTKLIDKIRLVLPDITLRTTFIVGFPGETEQDFTELCGFVEEIGFDRLGCFTFSPEEDTQAADMPNQIEQSVKIRRRDILMDIQHRILSDKNRLQIGQKMDILVEGYSSERGMVYGRSTADAPEIDCQVYFKTERKTAPGEFVKVEITGVDMYDLLGRVAEE